MTNNAEHELPELKHGNSAGEGLWASGLFAMTDRAALDTLLSCWEVLDERARLIVRRDGMLLGASPGAAAFLAREHCFGMKGEFVEVKSDSVRKSLKSLMRVSIGDSETIVMQRTEDGEHYVLSATGVFPDVVAIMITNAGRQFSPVFADLEEALGLTPSEVNVVEMLMEGQTPQRIAEKLEISVHTVRAHVRHCYDKLGISSREELWQKIAPLRLN